MPKITSFRSLRVYQEARARAGELFRITRKFPREEKFSLTDQITRSSRSVSALVAEAWGRRRYPASFRLKALEALGEAMETQAWLDHALDCGYIDVHLHDTLDAAWQKTGGRLHRMAEKAETFRTLSF